MKKSIIVISDYIENEPVVASVRFAGLMPFFKEKYRLIVINDEKNGSAPSRYADVSYKFRTPDSRFTQTMRSGPQAESHHRRSRLEAALRQKWIMSAWRNVKYGRLQFKRLNRSLFLQLQSVLKEENIAAVFLTIPDIYGLYLLECIKQTSPDIPAIIEIRDIINHSIGAGQPRFAFRRAERLISKCASGAAALSQGIAHYYQLQNPRLDIRLIRNGYDELPFRDSSYCPSPPSAETLTLAHIGSIYKGRNVKAFIEGLLLFHARTNIEITFNIVGLLDQQAHEDIRKIDISGTGVRLQITGSVEHEQAISLLKKADVAVILTHVKGSDYAVPGKTFEYIGACKPILAVTADRELKELIQGKYGECAAHDPADIASRLDHLIHSEYDFSDRHHYSRTYQAQELLQFMASKITEKEV